MSKVGRIKELLGVSEDTEPENLTDGHKEIIEQVEQ